MAFELDELIPLTNKLQGGGFATTAVIRYGWDRETAKVTRTVPAFDHFAITTPEQQQQLEQALIQADQDPRTFQEQAPPELVAAVEYYHQTGSFTFAVQNGEEKLTNIKLSLIA